MRKTMRKLCFMHSKIDKKHHQVHHGRNPFCIDKNYGGVLIIWDRIFGTFADRDEDVHYKDEKIAYGLVL